MHPGRLLLALERGAVGRVGEAPFPRRRTAAAVVRRAHVRARLAPAHIALDELVGGGVVGSGHQVGCSPPASSLSSPWRGHFPLLPTAAPAAPGTPTG